MGIYFEKKTTRRPTVSILSDLRAYASTNGEYKRRWDDLGVDFTEECLNTRAIAKAGENRKGIKKLVSVSKTSIESSRWAILCAWADTAGVRTWVKAPKR